MGRLVGTHSPCAPERKEGAACLQFAVTFSFYCGRPNNENGDDAMAPSVGSVSFPISQQRNQSIWTTLHPTFCVCCCAYSLLLLLSPTRRGYLSGCTVRERVPTDWPSRPSWLINQPIEASWLSFFLPEPLIPLRFSLFALFLLLFYLLFFFVSSGCFVRHLKVFRRDRLAGPLSSDVVPFAYWYRTGDEFPSISGDAPRSTPANANPGDWLRPAALTRPSPLIGPWPSRSVLCRITILLFFFPSVGIVLVALLSFRSGVSSASARPCRHRRASQALHLSCSLLFW